MARYKVGHDYAAARDGRRLAFKAGEVVEVDDSDAAHVEVDSPGTLVPVKDGAKAEPVEGDDRNGEPLDANQNGVIDSAETGEPLPPIEPQSEAKGGLLRRGKK